MNSPHTMRDIHGSYIFVIDRRTGLSSDPGRAAAEPRSRPIGASPGGKTSLARQFVSPASLNYFDLEDPQSLARRAEIVSSRRRVLRGDLQRSGVRLALIQEQAAHRRRCKRADAPALTTSMRTALADLKLDHLYVLYPGHKTYALGRRWR